MKVWSLIAALWMGISGSAFADDGKALAEKQVKDAIAFAKAKGKEAVVAEVNKGGFKVGEVYVTIFDTEGKCLAHPTKPARVGQNLMNEKDPDGKLFIKERIDAVKAGKSGWQTYKFQNPDTKKMEPKEAYYEGWEGLAFTAGAYSAPAKK